MRAKTKRTIQRVALRGVGIKPKRERAQRHQSRQAGYLTGGVSGAFTEWVCAVMGHRRETHRTRRVAKTTGNAYYDYVTRCSRCHSRLDGERVVAPRRPAATRVPAGKPVPATAPAVRELVDQRATRDDRIYESIKDDFGPQPDVIFQFSKQRSRRKGAS